MTGAVHDELMTLVIRNIRAQTMGSARLTGRGNIVQLALDCHERRILNCSEIDRLAMPVKPSRPRLARQKHLLNIFQEIPRRQIHQRREQLKKRKAGRIEAVIFKSFVKHFSARKEMAAIIGEQSRELMSGRIDKAICAGQKRTDTVQRIGLDPL